MRIEPISVERLRKFANEGISDGITIVDVRDKCIHSEVILDYDENNEQIVAVLDDDEGGYYVSEDYGDVWIAFAVEI